MPRSATLLVLAALVATSARAAWSPGSGGRVMWMNDCDFCGQDIKPVNAPPELCGDLCADDAACTHWTWVNNAQGGTCWLKDQRAAGIRSVVGTNCGYVTARFNPTSANLPPLAPGCAQ